MRISIQARLLFQALLDAPGHESYGYELSRVSGLKTGSLYPLLQRFEDERFVTCRWETLEESGGSMRRRRYYRLTGKGERVALEETANQTAVLRQLSLGLAT